MKADFLTTNNLYTASNVPSTHAEAFASYNSNEYRVRNRDQHAELATKYGFELYYECRQDTDYTGKVTYYIEHVYWLRVTEKGTVCMFRHNKGKFYFHPFYAYDRLVSYEQKRAFNFSVKEPNYIGVFTDKKVNDWLNYCDAYVAELNRVKAEVEGKQNSAKDKIEHFIKSVKGAEVSRYKNRVNVETSKFRVEFTVHENGYLSENIEYRGNSTNLINLLNK